MEQQIMKALVMEYAQESVTPEEIIDIAFITMNADVDYDVWLLESDTGSEYWVIQEDQEMNIFRKTGIINTLERVIACYEQVKTDSEEQEKQAGSDCYQDAESSYFVKNSVQ